MRKDIDLRNRKLAQMLISLPGCTPYVNRRPISVPAAFGGHPACEFLYLRFPHVDRARWDEALDRGEIVRRKDGTAIDRLTILPPGTQLEHVLADTVEPAVNASIRLLEQDEYWVVVDKPAPLPMHPCGRYCRNTLVRLLQHVFPDETFNIVHRLDADTSGVVVLARNPAAARFLVDEFQHQRIAKRYLAVVHGHLATNEMSCDLAIGKDSSDAGSRMICGEGKASRTDVTCLARLDDGNSVVEARPQAGRTHQIRLHLAALGHPIVGDPAYGPDLQIESGFVQGRMRLHAARLEIAHPSGSGPRILTGSVPAWIPDGLLNAYFRDIHLA